jgi:hypothetical protein
MSLFDPQAYLDSQISEPTVKRPPLPAGDYTAIIADVKSRTWQGKTDPTKSGIAFDIPLTVDIPADIQQQLGITATTLNFTDSIMLDLTESGTIDNGVGKNRRLRTYREATNMNKAGDVFSPRKMIGQVVTVKIKHDLWEGEIVEKIAGVAKA